MGTRADFYIGRGLQAEWLGSVAFDGYPDGISLTTDKVDRFGIKGGAEFPKGKHLFDSATPEQFKERLSAYFANRDDVSLPERDEWPWPWEDSGTSDYAYAFDDGAVWCSSFGHEWFDPRKEQPESDRNNAIFPNMKERQRVTLGKRSGLLVIGLGE